MEQDFNSKSIEQLCYRLNVEKKVEVRNQIITQLINELFRNITLFRNSHKLQKLVISIFLKYIEKQKNDCIKKNYTDSSLQKLSNYIRNLRKIIEKLTYHIKKAKTINDLIIYIRDTLVTWPLPLYVNTVQENIKILRILLSYDNYRNNISNTLKSNILGLCMQKLISYYYSDENYTINIENTSKYKSKEYVESDDEDEDNYDDDDDDEDYKLTESSNMDTDNESRKRKVSFKNNISNNKVFSSSKLEIVEISKCFSFLLPSIEIVYNDFSLEQEEIFIHPGSFDCSTISFIDLSKLSSILNDNTTYKSNKNVDFSTQYNGLYPSSITLQSLLIFFKAYLICYINSSNLIGSNKIYEQKSFIQIIGSLNFTIQEILRNNFNLALSFTIKIFDDILSQWDTKLLEMKVPIINFFRIFILIINRPKKQYDAVFKYDNDYNNANIKQTSFTSSQTGEYTFENNKNNVDSDGKGKPICIASSYFLYFDFKKYLYRLYTKIKSCEGSEFSKKFIIDHLFSKEVSFGEFLNNQRKSSYFEPSYNNHCRRINYFEYLFSPIFFDDISPKYSHQISESNTYHFNMSYSSEEVIFVKWAFYNLVSDLYFLILKIWQDHIKNVKVIMNNENKSSNFEKSNKKECMDGEFVDNMSVSSCSTELLFNSDEESKKEVNKENRDIKIETTDILKDSVIKMEMEDNFLNIELDILKAFNLISDKSHIILFTIQVILFIYKKWAKFISKDFTDKLVELLSFFLIENESMEIQIWVIAALAQICSNYSNCKFNKSSLSSVLSKTSIKENNNAKSENALSNFNQNFVTTINNQSDNNVNSTNLLYLELVSRNDLLTCNNSNEVMWNSIWNTLLHKVLIYNLTEVSFYFLGRIIQENVLSENIVHSGCNLLWKNIKSKSIPLVPSGVYFIINYLNIDNNVILTNKPLTQNLLQWLLSYFQVGIEVLNKKINGNDRTISIMEPSGIHSTPSSPNTSFNNDIFSTQIPANLFSKISGSINSQSKYINNQKDIDQLRFLRTPQLIAIFLSLFVTSINLEKKVNSDGILYNIYEYNQFQQYMPMEEMSFEYQYFNQYLHLNYFNYGHLKQFTHLNNVGNSYNELLNNFKVKDNISFLSIKENDENMTNNGKLKKKENITISQLYSNKESDHISFQDKIFNEKKELENYKNKKINFYSLNADIEYKSKINSFLTELIHYIMNYKVMNFDNFGGSKDNFINVLNNEYNETSNESRDNLGIFQNNAKSIKKRKIDGFKSDNIVTLFSEPQSIDSFDDNTEPSLKIDQTVIQKLQCLICWKLHFLNIFLNFIDIILHTSNKILSFENINSIIENFKSKNAIFSNDLIDLLFPNLLNDYSFINLIPDFFDTIVNDLQLLFQNINDKEGLIPVIDCLNNCFNIGNEYGSSNHNPFSLNIDELYEQIYNNFINIDEIKALNDVKENYFNVFEDTHKNSILLKKIYYILFLKEKNIDQLIKLIEKYFNLNTTLQQIGQKRNNDSNDDDFNNNNTKIVSLDYDLDINKSIQYYLYFHPFVCKPKIVYLNKILATSLIKLISINISKDIKYNNQYISFSEQINKFAIKNYPFENYSESLSLLTPKLSTHCIISFQFVQFIHIHKDCFSFDICKQIINILGESLNNFDIKNNIWTLCIILRCLQNIIKRLKKIMKNKENIVTIINPFLKYFINKCHILHWRVKIEFINFLVDCIILDNEENIFQVEKDLLYNTFFNFLNDQDQYVRYAFTLNLPNILKSFSQSKHINIYKEIFQRVNYSTIATTSSSQSTTTSIDNKNTEQQISFAYHFYAIAKYSFICRNESLYQLLYLSKNEDLNIIITNLLENLSYDLGTKNSISFLTEHLPSLIYLWIDDKNVKLKDFPFYYFNHESLLSFFKSNYKFIVPNLILKGQYDEIDYISKLINKSIKDIILDSFSKIMAFTLPLLFQDDQNLMNYGKTIYNKYIKVYLPGELFKNTCKENIVFIILELLYLIYDTNLLDSKNSSNPSITMDEKLLYQNDQSNLKIKFPNYKGITVLKAIDYILNLINENSLNHFLNVYRLPIVFNFFHEKIETTLYDEERQRLIYIYKYIIVLVTNHISEPFLFKSIIIRMIKYMENESLFIICSNIVNYILDNASVSSIVVNENMIQMVTLLLQQINTQSNPSFIKKIKSIIEKYTDNNIEKCPKFIRDEFYKRNISDYMDISKNEEENEYNSFYLNDIIKYDIDSYFSAIMIIHYILIQLDNKKFIDELINPQNKDILRKMLQWTRKFPISQELLQCIGKLNPYINSNLINPSLSTIVDDEDNKINHDVSISDLSDEPENTVLYPGHIIILKYLNECLYDYDIHVVSIAISLLQSILKTKVGVFAYNHLDDQYQKYLKVFIYHQKAYVLPKNSFCFTSKYHDIKEVETWSSCAKSYKEWVISLSCSLIISFYTDEVFDQLILLIEKHQKFSEHILPYIVYAILTNEHTNSQVSLFDSEQNSPNKNQYYQEEQQQLINSVRESINDSASKLLSKGINSVLKNFKNESPEALRTMLSVLIFLRKQPLPKATTQFDNNYWLDLDYKYVVQAAIKCNLPTAALLFIEISIDNFTRKNNRFDTRLNKRKRSLIRHQSKNDVNPQELKWYQDLLIDIYQYTDPDDFYALNYDISKDIRPLLRKYEHEKNWRKQLIFYERCLYTGNSKEDTSSSSTLSTFDPYHVYSNIAKSLNGLNLYHLSYNMINSVHSMDNYVQSNPLPMQETYLLELQYESAWKISQWDFEPIHHSEKYHREIPGIHYHIFNCLKFLKKRNDENFNNCIDNAWTFIENTIKFEKLDNKKYDFLSFQLINEIQEGWEMMNKKSDKYLEIWQIRTEIMKEEEFKILESILMLRTVILNIIIESVTTDNAINLTVHNRFKTFMINNLFTITKIAQKTGNLQSSQNSIELLNHIIRGNEGIEGIQDLQLYNRLIVEEAKILWNQEEPSLAINMIRKQIETVSSNVNLNQTIVINDNKDFESNKNEILYQLLSRLGHWIGIQRLENPSSIIENYMEKAVKLMESNDQTNRSSKVYFNFADYANNQYQVMCKPDICVQQKLLHYKEEELNVLNNSIKTSKSTNERNKYEIQKRRIETQIELDKAEINRVIQTREIFLVKAIENYLKTLNYSDEYDICIFRLIALWFGNKYNNLINQYIYKYIKLIESRKFLTLIYQLSARMSLTNTDKKSKYFILTVNALIQKMILDHPYHCLYQIIALRNGDILSSYDIQYFSSPEKRSHHLNSGIINKQTKLRIQAAVAMLHSVKKHGNLVQVIQNFEFLSEAYIELAALKFSANDRKKLINNKKPIAFGSKLKLSKIKELERVPITTKSLPVDPTCSYEDIVYVKGYKPSFQLIGGINLPKVIECIGSDGNIYKQLVKGSDDLRQDAVLSKIFNLVNVLLKKDQSIRKRQLSIRTYNIIPLSPRSGIIEWVQNTIPFGTYLTEAHPKYNKDDILPLECRMMLHNEQQRKNSTTKSKLAVYNNIVDQFKPVFRFFFQERFKDPSEWYNKKIVYTKSVSVNSVTGWVVGLGDRHCMNILIDVGTAEAIHIDLGIAFDAGKLLSIPECIPFRLTRDVVDGMGINGVEGVFRKSCEKTLQVLRKNSNVLLTILDVFRYDPLYNWTISPLKMARQVKETNHIQNEINGEEEPDDEEEPLNNNGNNNNNMENSSETKNNDDIERAFFGVRTKLSEQMSVECQINELIEMAMNPENLSRLFPGWQPYM